MSDSTLHIGTLASNNVNNIVNDTSKYDEYKEKVKELEKELQTRKDTFEKMTEPLVYVCDCYQKFNDRHAEKHIWRFFWLCNAERDFGLYAGFLCWKGEQRES